MSDTDDRFVVEADRKVVGIAVKVPGGYRFYSSDPDFLAIEGTTFPRAKAMAQRVAQIARLRTTREAAAAPSVH